MSSKDNYRARWIKHAEKIKNPLVNGKFPFQVHHLISRKSVKLADMQSLLVNNGYSINKIENLEGYPCTFEGACTLGVQLHRGNHGDQRDEEDDRESHPKSYHKKVSESLLRLVKNQDGEKPFCGDSKSIRKLEKEMDKISKNIRNLIADYEYKLTEASIANGFKKGNPIGCGNHTSIPEARRDTNRQPCRHGRQH